MELPDEIWDHILLMISPGDIPALCSTNLFFAALGRDPKLWKRNLEYNFNHLSEGLAAFGKRPSLERDGMTCYLTWPDLSRRLTRGEMIYLPIWNEGIPTTKSLWVHKYDTVRNVLISLKKQYELSPTTELILVLELYTLKIDRGSPEEVPTIKMGGSAYETLANLWPLGLVGISLGKGRARLVLKTGRTGESFTLIITHTTIMEDVVENIKSRVPKVEKIRFRCYYINSYDEIKSHDRYRSIEEMIHPSERKRRFWKIFPFRYIEGTIIEAEP